MTNYHAGVSLTNGTTLGFHTSTVQDPKIGVWSPLPGYSTYIFFAAVGQTKVEMAQELISKVKEIGEALHIKPENVKTFLEEYIAKTVAANTPKPPKVPKGTVTVAPPGTAVAPKASDPAKDANLNKIREAANKAKAAKKE